MSESGMTRYDPFEDTGDWPFRDAPPRTERPRDENAGSDDSPFAALGDTAIDTPVFDEPSAAGAPDEVAAEEVAVPQPLAQAAPEVAMSGQAEPERPAAESPPAEEPPSDEEPPPDEEPLPDEPGSGGDPEELPPAAVAVQHAPGGFAVPSGPEVLEGGPHGFRRNVAVVVSRFNGDITSRMLEATLAELRERHVADEAITVVPVPGAFELPLAAMALAKTRLYACVVALGCVIRGDTAHFDLVASEAASGLQLAAIETGIPVSFGVVTCETREQAEARIDRAAEAARTALEMADLFSHVRTRAAG